MGEAGSHLCTCEVSRAPAPDRHTPDTIPPPEPVSRPRRPARPVPPAPPPVPPAPQRPRPAPEAPPAPTMVVTPGHKPLQPLLSPTPRAQLPRRFPALRVLIGSPAAGRRMAIGCDRSGGQTPTPARTAKVIGQFSRANSRFIGLHFGREAALVLRWQEAARWRLLGHRGGRRRAGGRDPAGSSVNCGAARGREKKQGWSLQGVCGPGRHEETLFSWQPVAGGTCCRPRDRLPEGGAAELVGALPPSGTGLRHGSPSIPSFPRIKAGQVGGRARLGWAGGQGRRKVAVKKG